MSLLWHGVRSQEVNIGEVPDGGIGSGETTVDTALNRNGRVLIVGPSWVGDMVMAQSLFKTVKAEHPAAHIDVLAPEWTRPLTARMPEVADAISLPLGHGELRLSDRYRLGRSLAAKRYTHSIILPNSLKSALIPYFAGIPRRTGYRGEMRWGLLNDMRRLDRARAPMTVQRFVALARDSDQPVHTDFPVPRLEVPKGGLEYALGKLALQRPKGRVMALCPGAEYGPAKRWPAEHFVDIAKRKLDQGWAVWLYGSRKDAPVSSEIDRLTGNRCVDLAGRTKLDEAIDLMSIADVVVTNDSGLMHVAAALGRKIVALYGSSNASHTPPISDKAKVLSLGLSCSPCYKRECPLGHLKCLRDLSPGQVLAAVDELCP